MVPIIDKLAKSKYRFIGYASKLIKLLSSNFKSRYNEMIVGADVELIPFFAKQGFDKYEKTIKNFFIDNYDEEIKDENLVRTDMIYYSKEIKM